MMVDVSPVTSGKDVDVDLKFLSPFAQTYTVRRASWRMTCAAHRAPRRAAPCAGTKSSSTFLSPIRSTDHHHLHQCRWHVPALPWRAAQDGVLQPVSGLLLMLTAGRGSSSARQRPGSCICAAPLLAMQHALTSSAPPAHWIAGRRPRLLMAACRECCLSRAQQGRTPAAGCTHQDSLAC
jgi:hypothetical protein